MANRKRSSVPPFYEGLLNALVIEILAFTVAYLLAKAAGIVD